MDKNQKLKVKPLFKKSYLAVNKNSEGKKIFANFYGKIGNKTLDLTNNGKLSCAYFVSAISKISDLIKKVHLTVKNTVKDMKESGWYLVKKPKTGSVLVWEEKKFNKDKHFHVGFYLGKKIAISNNSKKGFPTLHHWSFCNKRKVIAIYWHKKLDKDL